VLAPEYEYGQPLGDTHLRALLKAPVHAGIVRATPLTLLSHPMSADDYNVLGASLADPDPLLRIATQRVLRRLRVELRMRFGTAGLTDSVCRGDRAEFHWRAGGSGRVIRIGAQKFPADFDIAWALATIYRDRGEVPKALSVSTQLLERHSRILTFLHCVSRCLRLPAHEMHGVTFKKNKPTIHRPKGL
jgi:hypothetical protein